MRMHKTTTISLALVLLLFCGAAVARAQQPPASPAGPLVLESMHNGFLLAPDVKVTKVNGQVGTLAGGYAGWVRDDRLFIGGGAYWRADRKRDTDDLAYGGLIVGWFFDPDRPVSVSARALAGFGQFSQSFASGTFVDGCDWRDFSHCRVVQPIVGDNRFDQRFRFRNDFLVLEPEVNALFKLSKSVHLSAGAGYRLIDGARGLDQVTRGATGSVSVQFRLGR
jgi:hypothetical protein